MLNKKKTATLFSIEIVRVLALSFFLTGCAPRGLFYWGDYESSLYERYIEQNPAQAEAYLKESIVEAEQKNYRVPPGAYADYGFLLYRRGDKEAAIAYFAKEKQIYPESSALMTKLIERVQMQMEQTSSQQSDDMNTGNEQ